MLQFYLRHENIKTTEGYLRLRTDPEVRAALAQRAQDVAAHYRKPKPEGRQDGGNKALQEIGAAFGFDLFPTPPK